MSLALTIPSDGKTIIPQNIMLDFGSNYHEIQPGLAVCLSTSADMQKSGVESSFPGDKDYIHLNCQLDGIFEAKVKNVFLDSRCGDINMGFSDGEIFYTRHSENFCNFALMIMPNVLHNLAGEELSGLNFDEDISFFVKQAAPNQKVTNAARQIAFLMKQTPTKSLLLHSAILDYLYWHLTALQEETKSKGISFREKKQLLVAKDYLLNDLSAAPTIAELAKIVGLNQCKLKKGFKSLFGSSIYAHFQEERMHRAMQLLKSNNVTETAMVLGYSNFSHFSTAFRKQFGILPKEARREIEPIIYPLNYRYQPDTHQ
ncbi:MAG: AraC family transcriptional regulator [Colwellia sp.]|jgi:AraC family transcriptional regulator